MHKNIFLNENSGSGLMSRDKIDLKYTWNLTDIYETEELWEKDFQDVKSKINDYKKYDGEFSKSADQLLELLQFDEKVGTMYDRLHLYSFLSKDLDLADTKYQAMAGRLQDLGSKLSGATSFIRPEMISIGKDKIKQFISEKTIELFFTQDDFKNGLGWMMDTSESFMKGGPAGTFGHTGFTGTSIVVVPSLNVSVILLINRQNMGLLPSGYYYNPNPLRKKIVEAVLAECK